MKVIVLGAGVIGVTTAYYLAKDGHEVIVIDQAPSSANGCSFANGGQLSYSHIDSWSNKSFLTEMFFGLFKPNSFITLNDFSNKNFYRWIYQFIKNSNPKIAIKNSLNLYKLSSLSSNLMEKILKEEPEIDNGKSFDYHRNGILHFYRHQKSFNNAIDSLEYFKKTNLSFEILNADQCIKKEPSLEKILFNKKLVGGIYFPNDASGDCYKFISKLEKICREKYSVKFIFNCEIKNILTNYKKITGINTENGVFVADKYVYALGAISDKLLKGIKINTSIYPVKGYSLSIKSTGKIMESNIALTDNENKIVYSKLGDILRIAGTIEMSGNSLSSQQKNLKFLHKIFNKTFDIDYKKNDYNEWCGSRPFRPNSMPLIGRIAELDNLYLNTGHGSLGWTNSLSSAKIISEIINHKTLDDFKFLQDEFIQIYNH